MIEWLARLNTSTLIINKLFLSSTPYYVNVEKSSLSLGMPNGLSKDDVISPTITWNRRLQQALRFTPLVTSRHSPVWPGSWNSTKDWTLVPSKTLNSLFSLLSLLSKIRNGCRLVDSGHYPASHCPELHLVLFNYPGYSSICLFPCSTSSPSGRQKGCSKEKGGCHRSRCNWSFFSRPLCWSWSWCSIVRVQI